VICGKLILADGAWFTGTARPERADQLGERHLTLAWQKES
jgi:hypothetical protein